jgi:hypothetical protein
MPVARSVPRGLRKLNAWICTPGAVPIGENAGS